MLFAEQNTIQVRPTMRLIFRRDHQQMSKLIDDAASCSDSDISIDGCVQVKYHHYEECHNYIDDYVRSETIVPSFYRKVDRPRNESCHRCVSITIQNQTPPRNTGSSLIPFKSSPNTVSTRNDDLREVFGRYVDENQMPPSVRLPALHENHRSYSKIDLIYRYRFKPIPSWIVKESKSSSRRTLIVTFLPY